MTDTAAIPMQTLLELKDASTCPPSQRIVTAHPLFPDASLETTWNNGKICVYSGPDSSPRILHASFAIHADISAVVWTSFEDAPHHSVLCALLHTTQICIWDVYPQQSEASFSLPAEGWTISLPFECSNILAIQGRGILLQRLEYAEDEETAVDGFILKSPPTATRRVISAVPSLFSLTHPLQDVLPVCLMSKTGMDCPPVTDVHEKWTWMGTVQGEEPLLLVLSYHTLQKRHRLWEVRDAPPPPREPAVYEQARFPAHDDLMVFDMDLLGSSQLTPFASRQEALADALGLRRSPRKADTAYLSPRPRGSSTSESPFAPLHARLALELLYSSPVQLEVESSFLVSNTSATSNSVLCCVSPDSSAKILQFWSIERDASNVVKVVSYPSIACLGALPLQTIPESIEVLIHRVDGTLSCFRAWHLISDCSVPDRVLSMQDPFLDRVTLTLQNADRRIRTKLSLKIDTDLLTDRVLKTLDAAFEWLASKQEGKEHQYRILALKIRADCYRLATKVASTFVAMEHVLVALAKFEWYGSFASENSTGGDLSVWERLLASDCHRKFEQCGYETPLSKHTSVASISGIQDFSTETASLSIHFMKSESLSGLFPCVFDHFHLLYEDMKLTKSQGVDAASVKRLLAKLCHAFPDRTSLNILKFRGFYEAEFGANVSYQPRAGTNVSTSGSPVLSSLADNEQVPSIFAWFEKRMSGDLRDVKPFGFPSYPLCSHFVKTNSLVRIAEVLFPLNGKRNGQDVISRILTEGHTSVFELSESFPPGFVLPMLEVLKKFRDLSDISNEEMRSWTPQSWKLVGREDISMNLAQQRDAISQTDLFERWKGGLLEKMIEEIDAKTFTDTDMDGLVPLELSSALLFPEDNRIHEATRLLRSSRPMFLKVARAVELNDHDFERLKQKRLHSLILRSLALPVGRGMLTIGNLEPIPAEPLPVPELCLRGRVPPTNAGITLDLTDSPSDLRVWPEFHNGVAAGLRLPSKNDSSDLHISRTWIIYNKPPPYKEQTTEGAEPNTEILFKNHSHGGVLLALGLRGHLTALEMSDLYEYLTQGTVTTTVGILLGLAADKRGSCDIAVSKMLCLHIPSLIPQHFSAVDVASTVQSAAILGTGLLFQGSSHRMMTEFLLNEIGKRPDSDASTFDRESYNLVCGIALGMVNLCLSDQSGGIDRAAGLADLHLEERLHKYVVGGVDKEERERTREANDRFSLPSTVHGGDNEKCSTIHEGDLINTEVTSPGATLALGLMHMKSGNHTLASALALPDTHFLLEFVRPDLLTYRIIARSLILWDDVVPSIEWIESQVPSVVNKAYALMRTMAKRATEGKAPLATDNVEKNFDRRATRQIYVHSIAGACFGMGLRFAGTGNKDAQKAIEYFVLELYALRESKDPVAVASKPELQILETALGCAAISLAMVMAGSGDINCLKVFKMLRWRCDEEARYGFHMICGMAIGLLFLGGGTGTLGREPEDIAVLLVSFFPRFPSTTSDNQCHLQPLRHLYALAVKRQEVRAVDVDSGKDVAIQLEIWSDDCADPDCVTVPALLRNSDCERQEIQIASPEYFPLKLRFKDHQRCSTIFVKKRSTPLDALQSCQSVSTACGSLLSSTRSRTSVSLDRILLAENGNTDNVLLSLLEGCLLKDTDGSLPLILSLCRGGTTADLKRNYRLLESYIRKRSQWGEKTTGSDELFLLFLRESMNRSME
ncbi:anaphase-promoting complex subunit 1 [Fistulifera solaris]|jgi:anaphase-promoting complex subunit 1|uniref:Anaphase-promoting complex subunit 1 n=1 Tax=Fistulifera solaris TaxID=1519565 RepID=A0A1Z5KQ25_FISSO|nr:anaphase-promoting complex subunit 1 [Fistulifera solaris]|eukprot:GAX28424.1 anaphase-promoting complex subunit 1 [Fistulifera solaris]